MKTSEEDIKKAIENVKSRNLANIVRHYYGYIIMAQSEDDFKSKVNSINNGDCFGFYTIERALFIKNKNNGE